MKRFEVKTLMAFLITMTVMGCASQKQALNGPATYNPGGSPLPTPPICVGTACPSPTPYSCPTAPTPYPNGANVTLTAVSVSVLRDYVGTPLNNPGTITLNVNLSPYTITTEYGTYKSYGGDMHIRFLDNQGNGTCIDHNGSFTAGSGAKVFDNGGESYDTKFNSWDPVITSNTRAMGKFRAFFEDALIPNPPGALILTVDSVTDINNLSGSVYYYNFHSTAYHPPTFCWFVYTGPYDCRDFTVPPTGTGKFRKLGTFTNLDRSKAMPD